MKTTQQETAAEVIARLKTDNPGRRFATNGASKYNEGETAIAVHNGSEWVMLLATAIHMDGWFRCPNLLVNGEPVIKEWQEV